MNGCVQREVGREESIALAHSGAARARWAGESWCGVLFMRWVEGWGFEGVVYYGIALSGLEKGFEDLKIWEEFF